MREPRGRRAGERVSGIPGRSALVLGCVKTEQVKQRLEGSSSRWAISRRKVLRFRVPGANFREKF